ncbi:MAG: helix-turn-helix domain-containing protein [Erysipelotrichaceae bacterium]|nr:helix-turn-helix domain-containing protein [Erysipelotrichaceae bacterium]
MKQWNQEDTFRMNNVGKNIKNLRRSADLTQDDLAERIHVTRQTVSNYETGRSEPDIEMMGLIAEALGTDITGLIYGKKKEASPEKPWFLFVMLMVSAVVSIFIHRYAGVLSARGSVLFVVPYAVYVLLHAALPLSVWLCGFLGGALLQRAMGFRYRKPVYLVSVLLSACAGLFLAVFAAGYTAAGHGYLAYAGFLVPMYRWLTPVRNLLLPAAFLLGLTAGITSRLSGAAENSSRRSSCRLAVLAAVPVLILGLYLFKYEAPWLYRSHRSDERIQYRVPHEEMVLTFYQRINGDLSVSHKYISAEYFLNAEVRLPDYRNTPWLRQNRKDYMEDWPGPADLEMIQGRTWLIPSDEEQILCIDRNHSLHADPAVYLEETDNLWMITVCTP